MSFQQKKVGYCAQCTSNELHLRKVSDGIFLILDICTLGTAETFRIGPWFCTECDHRQLYLPAKKSPQAIEKIIEANERENPELRSVGNFLKSERSLVQRAQRSSRFSIKFRDDLIMRILNGSTTVQHVRAEHNLTEQDLVDWVKDMTTRDSSRIPELKRLLADPSFSKRIAMQGNSNSHSQPGGMHSQRVQHHDVIEGKVRAN